ncbi:MAG: dTMP kinase [Kiritimatiellia bacterium]
MDRGKRGAFISFEGPEGSGKSTHAERLAERLRGTGQEVIRTREPGGTPAGEVIRNVLLGDWGLGNSGAAETEIFLFAAGRAELTRSVIRPSLGKGACVISDRFGDSTTAYQGYGRGWNVEKIIALNSYVTDGLQPDVTFLLDLDVRAGFERVDARRGGGASGYDRIERGGMEFHDRVRSGYLELAKRWPERFRIIDARGEPETVQEEIWSVLVNDNIV